MDQQEHAKHQITKIFQKLGFSYDQKLSSLGDLCCQIWVSWVWQTKANLAPSRKLDEDASGSISEQEMMKPRVWYTGGTGSDRLEMDMAAMAEAAG